MSRESIHSLPPVDPDEAAELRKTFVMQTAPFDARFPNQNQTKHCWQAYVDYHKCINLKGEEERGCKQFYRVFKSLCPNTWVDNWDDQRERGVFPYPLV